MKYLSFFLTFLSAATWAQTTNGDGRDWVTDGNWVGGSYPGSLAGGTLTLNAETISIDHYTILGSEAADVNLNANDVNEAGGLSVEDSDTLIIYGNVTLGVEALPFGIGNASVVIVLGDFTINNKADISASGILVVSGQFRKGGSQGTFSGSGTVYAGSYAGGAQTENFIPGTVGASGDQQQTIDDLSDDGFPDIEEFVDGEGAGVLPVDLVSFSSETSIEGNELNWRTASEINNDFFSVQRSENGSDFYEIGVVDGNGTTNDAKSYSFTDGSPIASVEYYRLKQVDFDGAFEVHQTIVAYSNKISSNIDIETYPNPASEKISLKSVSPMEFRELVLIDISGKVVANLKNTLNGNGLKMESPLPQLEKGLYQVRYTTMDGKSGAKKLFIR